ncbi:MAG: Extracellular ligand-binding receptor [Thermotoga sp. 50_1627]|nr:MAG: Extracellular ligand-binding receptor [Thermotoga sp. 50_64]KUK25870.1 MAG: Extracellular ligand-binding receptor [Thermotoga sp. 50_1627]MDK2922836.1 branched-chain amino acid transport system substrate-binding protein [Pseudothermotoga sp.]
MRSPPDVRKDSNRFYQTLRSSDFVFLSSRSIIVPDILTKEGLLVVKRVLVIMLMVASLLSFAAVKIGFFAPITGPAAADGTSALHGAQLAVEYINSHGGVLGQPAELVWYDDNFKADQAVNIAYKLVQQDKVAVVVSGSYSGMTRAAAGIYQQLKVPMISAYAVHPDIVATGEYIFRVGTLATVQGRAGAHLAVEKLGAKKIAILTVDNDFGVSLTAGFKEEAIKLGAEIVFEQKYPLGETDFRPLLSRIRNARPDVIYATGYFSEAARFVTQARQMGIFIPIIGQEGYDSPQFAKLAEAGAANGVVITTDLNRDSEKPIVRWFIEEYAKRYGLDADMVGASAFDAVMAAAKAIEIAGSYDPAKIRDALATIKAGDEELEDFVTGFRGFTEKRESLRTVTCQIYLGNRFHWFWEVRDPKIVTP